MKRISILGSTGSIGKSALDIVLAHKDKFNVIALTAGKNISLLEKQIKTFTPEAVAVADSEGATELRRRLGKKFKHLQILYGQKGIVDIASLENIDFVLSAIVGAAGLMPTLSAVRKSRIIGLANKESLVMAGSIVFKEARKYKTKILPVDSEHSAVFQCLHGQKRKSLRKIILTASGGPFACYPEKDLKKIKPEEALEHPNWQMGKKITIDSATLMNKGLEVIEAYHLFNLSPERIEVLIHPQSIIHSMVEFNDSSILAQLSVPDMKGPIAYALNYPQRLDNVIKNLPLQEIGTLTFMEPDNKKFPCLSYAYEALKEGGTMPAVLNAANEVAVNAFLKGAIGFCDIPVIIKKTMELHTTLSDQNIEYILESDRWARNTASEIILKKRG